MRTDFAAIASRELVSGQVEKAVEKRLRELAKEERRKQKAEEKGRQKAEARKNNITEGQRRQTEAAQKKEARERLVKKGLSAPQGESGDRHHWGDAPALRKAQTC